MSFDFDEIIDRRKTHSAKWDMMEQLYGVSNEDGISMWVADMDFRPPPAVSEAFQQLIDHGVYGYSAPDEDLRNAIAGWMQRRHGWTVDPAWVNHTYGLVNALAICIEAYSEKGDGVIVFSPVYHAFAKIVNANDRRLVQSELTIQNGAYHMDLAALEAQLQGDEKLVFLCSPHNPGGRIWSAEELRELADFCIKHDLILISDEVHHDLILGDGKHVVAPLAMPHALDRLVMLVATSKTFNLAGAMTGHVIISDDNLRNKFTAVHAAYGISSSRFGMFSATAAYNHGDEWLEDLLVYINRNRRIFEAGMAEIPGVKPMQIDATYLTWIDFAGTGMSDDEIDKRLIKAGVAANVGATFGTGGETFRRFNLGTRKALVEQAVTQLKEAFADLQ